MKTQRRSLILLLLSLFAFAPLHRADAQPTAPIERLWTVDGVKRTALMFLPATATTVKAPVVFAFHGHGGSAMQASRSFRFQTAWPEAIVVYMQGLPTVGQLTDPDGTRAGWQAGIGNNGDRDLKFFDAVYASLKTDYKVDETRVFATGHSNGGGMTYLLWAARGDVFRAVAPCSAVPSRTERNLKPKPALHIAGQTDPLVKYAWQEMAINLIKKVDGCYGTGTPWATSGDLVGTLYSSPTGTPVVTLIHPGGHKFPQEATDLVVRFFKENSGGK